MSDTALLFRDDAYLDRCEATVADVLPEGVVLDRTVFYAASGGQPGDTGRLVAAGGEFAVGAAAYAGGSRLVHPLGLGVRIAPGERVRAEIDWPRLHAHMRMHTALHLLCALVPFPVTGGAIGAEESRLDFDIAEAGAIDREAINEGLARLVAADHPVSASWITDAELAAKPDLVRTMRVKPPMGIGRVRLVLIGEDGAVDSQPCGGTHVRSTAEIGGVEVFKIEKKGRENRRIRLRFSGQA